MKTKICVIAGILAIGSVFFSCATNKGLAETGMNVVAKGSSDGIILHFSNIPEDTTDIVLAFVDMIERNRPENVVFINYENLDELKKTGVFLCPFSKEGYEYFIRVYRHKQSGEIEYFYTGAVAGGGIYLTNNPLLYFTNGNNTLALSELPTFSEEVSFYQEGFLTYYSYLRRDNGHFLGIGADATNELQTDLWRPDAEIQEDIANNFSIIFSGDMPVFATASCTLNYGNTHWFIGLAETEDVIASF